MKFLTYDDIADMSSSYVGDNAIEYNYILLMSLLRSELYVSQPVRPIANYVIYTPFESIYEAYDVLDKCIEAVITGSATPPRDKQYMEMDLELHFTNGTHIATVKEVMVELHHRVKKLFILTARHSNRGYYLASTLYVMQYLFDLNLKLAEMMNE